MPFALLVVQRSLQAADSLREWLRRGGVLCLLQRLQLLLQSGDQSFGEVKPGNHFLLLRVQRCETELRGVRDTAQLVHLRHEHRIGDVRFDAQLSKAGTQVAAVVSRALKRTVPYLLLLLQ